MINPRPKSVSIVVPCFNEAAGLASFVARLEAVTSSLPQFETELIFVDDGSLDATLQFLLDYAQQRSNVVVLELSRNFGKEAALTAGIDFARGDAVIPIDADLQHPPELIPALVAAWQDGNDVVLARRRDRSRTTASRWTLPKVFYSVHNRLAEVALPESVGDFRLMDRTVVQALRQLPERRRFMKGLFAWVGFRQTFIDFDVNPRTHGHSTFSRRALWSLALEGLTSFSTAPLRIASWLGLVVALLALVHGCWIILKTLYFGVDLPGYASIMSAVLFLGGIQLLCIGVLGEYVGRTYSETKQRPIYLVRRQYGRPSLGDCQN